MIRNFKALGLVLIAVLALSAVGASAAQAQLKLTTTGPTWLTLDPIGNQTFTAGSLQVPCTGVGGHATVVNNQTEIKATSVTYTGCTGSIAGSVVTVTMNSCSYQFHGGKTDPGNAEHGIEGEVDLVCPAGGPVIDIYQNATKHTEGVTLCKLTIAPFTNKKEITYTNTAGSPNDVDLKYEVTMNYTREGSILCPASGTGTERGEVTATGFVDEGTNANGTPKEGARTGVTVS